MQLPFGRYLQFKAQRIQIHSEHWMWSKRGSDRDVSKPMAWIGWLNEFVEDLSKEARAGYQCEDGWTWLLFFKSSGFREISGSGFIRTASLFLFSCSFRDADQNMACRVITSLRNVRFSLFFFI